MNVAQPQNRPAPHRPIELCAADQAPRASVPCMTNSQCDRTASVRNVFVFEYKFIFGWLTIQIVVADNASRISSEVGRQQRNSIVEHSDTRAEDRFARLSW